jgi:hypothetical protein
MNSPSAKGRAWAPPSSGTNGPGQGCVADRAPGSSKDLTDSPTLRKPWLAARAEWLYEVAGNTQDEIAAKLNVSRQAVERLVSLAGSEGSIRHRLDHPLSECKRRRRQSPRLIVGGQAWPEPARAHADRPRCSLPPRRGWLRSQSW